MELNILELYSGIGGMHMAVKDACVPGRVVAAVDINTSANAVYRSNFPETPHMQRNVQSLTAHDLDSMRLDMLTMSPPCQPFSRLGKRADVADARTSSLLHVLRQLVCMRRPPRFVLVENVRGFERSEARTLLVATLGQLGLHWREFLVSPLQLGVPNSRTRYYLIARTAEFPFPALDDQEQVATELPYCVCSASTPHHTGCPGCGRPVLRQLTQYLATTREIVPEDSGDSVPTLATFLSGCGPPDPTPLLLPDRTLARYAELLDIVTPSSRRCCCFTSGYGHLVEGAGSVLLPDASVEQLDAAFTAARSVSSEEETARVECLRPLRLRRFSPAEVARLMCYPAWFRLPAELSDRQRYKLVGNSVNVRVVTAMMLTMLHAPCHTEDPLRAAVLNDHQAVDETRNCDGSRSRESVGNCDGSRSRESAMNCDGSRSRESAMNCDGSRSRESVGNCDGSRSRESVGNCDGSRPRESARNCDGSRSRESVGNCDGSRSRESVGICDGSRRRESARNCDGSRSRESVGNCDGSRSRESVGNCDGSRSRESAMNCDGSRPRESVGNCDGSRSRESVQTDGAPVSVTGQVRGASVMTAAGDGRPLAR